MPRERSAASKVRSAAAHVGWSSVGAFFVNTQDGRVATYGQLAEAGFVDESDVPVEPWFRIQGPSDASTMWYRVMRKETRGVFIGTLCIRHTDRKALLEREGWEEVPVEEIGVRGQAM
jgi:alkylated DNA nucleotide flippase Atl1